MIIRLTLLGILLLHTSLQATTLALGDVYAALHSILPIATRTSLVAQEGHARIQQALSPYHVQVTAEGQGTLTQRGETVLSTALTATLPLVPETEQQNTLNKIKTVAEIQRLTEVEHQLTQYTHAITLYFEALTAQDAAAHVDKLLGILSQQKLWLQKQIRIGRRKPSAMSSVQLSITRLQLQKAEYLHKKRDTMLRLSSMTGIDPERTPSLPHAPTPNLTLESQLYQRPDLHKKQLLIQHFEHELTTLEWSFWPHASAFGTLKYNDTQTGMLGLMAEWRLLDGASRENIRLVLSTQRDLEALALQETLRAARGALWAQHNALDALETECRLAETAVLTAASQYRQYQEEYAQNLVTLLDVLQTLHSWHEAQLDLSRRQIALQAAIALLPVTLRGEIPK